MNGSGGPGRPSQRKAYTRACPECGAQVAFDERKCPACEALVGRSRRLLQPAKSSFVKDLIIIIAVVVVLVGGGFAAALFFKPSLVPARIRQMLKELGVPVPEKTAPEAEEPPAETEKEEETEAPEAAEPEEAPGEGE